MNVDRPRARLSDGPMRVKIRSITGSTADSLGWEYFPITPFVQLHKGGECMPINRLLDVFD
jgi:hypothetical protein